MTQAGASSCHVCHAPMLDQVLEFTSLRRVTSDCKPWPAGGSLAVCTRCGTVQKLIDPHWQKEVSEIYSAYSIYQNSGGVEQPVFSGDGQGVSRSSRLVEQLRDRVGLPDTGRLLDVGCGNGAMLRSVARLLPGWSLAGTEIGEKYRAAVESISGVEQLYTCDPTDVPGQFDVITLLHVLEHVPDPVNFLKSLAKKLKPNGLLVVEVPDHRQNPFDLLIADHCSHFSRLTLRRVFEAAGLSIAAAVDDWIPKELTVVGRADAKAAAAEVATPPDIEEIARGLRARVNWLESLAAFGRSLADRGPLGVFGTSIAGAWLFSELGEGIDFFVDEDSARIGRSWQGRTIHHPSALPDGSRVLIGLSPVVAGAIKRRLDNGGIGGAFELPPTFAHS